MRMDAYPKEMHMQKRKKPSATGTGKAKINVPAFNMDEWRQVNVPRSRYNSSQDGMIKYSSGVTAGKPYVSFSFGNEILAHLSLGNEMRAMIMQHRDDMNRIIMFASPNGYKVNRPSKKNHKSYMRISNRDGQWPETELPILASPILHPKGISSSTVVEFNLSGDGEHGK